MGNDSREHLPPAIFLMGPTASGKTHVAVELVQQLPLEIISVDSAMVYREMNIGTAKPDAATLAKAPHHLIDIRDPSEPYSASFFRDDALRVMSDIVDRGKIPLLVGGTMLYYKALLEGLAEMPATTPDVRAAIEADAAKFGWPTMHARLAAIDPETASQLHPNHSQRIGRALEVYEMSGKTLSSLRAMQVSTPMPYRVLQIAVAPRDRNTLNLRIEARFHQMMQQGFLTEVQHLFERGDLSPELPSIRAVGYRQAWELFAQPGGLLGGNLNREQMVQRAIIATRQLAKHQFTWLRSWQNLQWMYPDDITTADSLTGAHSMEAFVAEVRKMVETFVQ